MDIPFDAVRLASGAYVPSAIVLPTWRALLRVWRRDPMFLPGLLFMVDPEMPLSAKDIGNPEFHELVKKEELVNSDDTVFPVVAEFIRNAVVITDVDEEADHFDMALEWPLAVPIYELTEFTGEWGISGPEWDGVEDLIFKKRGT